MSEELINFQSVLKYELPNAGFVSYAGLASLAGVTAGSLANEGAGWLVFELDGKRIIVSKKNIRINLSWDNLNAAGCVVGTKQVTIQGVKYKVRLAQAIDTSLSVGPNITTPGMFDFYKTGTHNSEWSRLFYPITRNDLHLPYPPGNSNGRFTCEELDMTSVASADMSSGNYVMSWTKEAVQENVNYKTLRGGNGPSAYYRYNYTNAYPSLGWRPFLEKV